MWVIGELSMFYAGAINVPLSIKLEESNDLMFRLEHAMVKYIMVSKQQLGKIRLIIDKLPLVEKIIVLDKIDSYQEKEIFVEDVMAMGKEFLASHTMEEFLAVGQSIQNDDYATITYTSGTTADPKGVVLTHRNYTANVEQALTLVNIDQTWRTLIILPLDHCFAHVVGFYIMMSVGATAATTQVGRTPLETLKNIPLNIKEVRPHFILSVPALAKTFKKNIEQAIRAKGPTVERLFNWGMKIRQVYYGDSNLDFKGLRYFLKPLVWFFDKIIFSKVRENFGGELRFFIGGGALLDKDLQKFYVGVGMPMFQGYGLSEATPVISSNGPELYRFGSSGKLVKPIDLKICDSEGRELPVGEMGEIVVKGENVMAGYWKNPESTAETVRNGYLYTGDLGYMSKEGLLYVKGRFKSLLISSDGEKYSPEGIEEALVEKSVYIDQVMLYNNQSNYTTAVLVPNRDQLLRTLKSRGLDLSSEEGRKAALEILDAEVGRFKKGGEFEGMFPERWLPSCFAVLAEPFTEQNQMINSTMKMVRGKIEKAYAARIDYMYTTEGKKLLNPQNLDALK
jgi:long-chain acyl-CoA synthetase